MTTQPTDPLLALVWHGGFTPVRDNRFYFGRYAMQGTFTSDAVQALIDRKWAERQGPSETYQAVFPTRAGLEEALRREPSNTAASDVILAVLGSRRWEGRVGGRAAIVGVFLSPSSVSALVEGLAGLMTASPQLASVYLATIGGIMPAAIADGLKGTEQSRSAEFELVHVPPELSAMVGLARRYRFMLDVRPKQAMAVLFQWAGSQPRLVAPLKLRSLTDCARVVHPEIRSTVAFAELEAALDGFDSERELGVLL